MRVLILGIVMTCLGAGLPLMALAQTAAPSQAALKKYNVTIRRFDPTQGASSGQEFVLPVDSPDEEQVIASTIANAASFSKKAEGGKALPVAFMAVRVAPR